MGVAGREDATSRPLARTAANLETNLWETRTWCLSYAGNCTPFYQTAILVFCFSIVGHDSVKALFTLDFPGEFSGKVLLTRYDRRSTLGFPIPARFSRNSRPEVTHGHLYTHQPGLLHSYAGALGSPAQSQAHYFESEITRRMGRRVGTAARQCGYRRCQPFRVYGSRWGAAAAASASGGASSRTRGE